MGGGDWGKGVDVYSAERLRPEAPQQNRVRGRIGGVIFEAGAFELLAGDCGSIYSSGGAWGKWVPENHQSTVICPKWYKLAIDTNSGSSATKGRCHDSVVWVYPAP